jgi:hypothetical protein
LEYVLAQVRPILEWRKRDYLGRTFVAALLYLGIVYNPGEGLMAASWWAAICLGCAALAWLHRYRVLGFLCLYMILPVFAGSGYGLFRAVGLAP